MSYLGLNLACRNDSNTKSIYTNRPILPMTVILCPGIYNSAIQETTWRWGDCELCDVDPAKSNTVCDSLALRRPEFLFLLFFYQCG